MEKDVSHKKRPSKQGKTFRLSIEANRQLGELTQKTGRSEAMIIEIALEKYYAELMEQEQVEK